MKAWYIAALALLAMGCVTTSSTGVVPYQQLFDTWLGVAAILLLLSLLVMLLVYMFGVVLTNDRMKAWAKLELFEIIYSVLILAFALFALSLANNVVDNVVHDSDPYTQCICSPDFQNIPGSIYYGVQECHVRLALYFLSTVFSETRDFALKTYISYTVTATLADAQLTMENVFEPAGMITFTPWRGIWALGNVVKNDVFDKAILLMTVAMFQEVLVRFIATAFFPVVFVLGVVLRSFTFTRRVGGLLMAIALALFFIYPMFYAFGALVINQIKIQSYDPSDPATINAKIADHFYVKGSVPLLGYADDQLDLSVEQEKALEALDTTDTTSSTPFCRRIRVSQRFEQGMYNAQQAAQVDSLRLNIYSSSPPEAERNTQLDELEQRKDTWFGKVAETAWTDRFWVGGMFKSGGAVDTLARLAFFSVFFGLLGILATIAAIKNLSIFLGGDTEIAGLTHLI